MIFSVWRNRTIVMDVLGLTTVRSSGSSINMSVNASFASLSTCFQSRPGMVVLTAFSVTNSFLLPLFILVLYAGCRRWKKQRSGAAAAVTSHSDIFTYNVVSLELISMLGCVFYCFGTFTEIQSFTQTGMDLFSFTSPGQTLFHVLTCVERYLAVVCPITYLQLRQTGGSRLRNISILCVWLLCFVVFGITKGLDRFAAIVVQSLIVFSSLSVVSYCSIAVLRVLIRPGPGDGSRDRGHIDQTKRRAFHTITAVMAALWLRFVGILSMGAVYESTLTNGVCAAVSSAVWLTLPGSLVLPVLFLHRAGKLPGCKHSS